MFLHNFKKFTIDNFIIPRDREREDRGNISKLVSRVSRGHTLWEGHSFRLVLPYHLLAIFLVFLLTTIILNFILHPGEVDWFKSTLELSLMTVTVAFFAMHIKYGKSEEELGSEVDGWWNYKYLEEETLEIKQNIERKLNVLLLYYINLVNVTGVGYCMIPLLKYIYSGGRNIGDLLVIDSLHDTPWVYLEIVCGVLSVIVTFNNGVRIISMMITVLSIHQAQLQVAGLAYSTIEHRVIRMMGEWNENDSNDEDQHDNLVQNEIVSCSKHCQAIFRQTKQLYKIASGPVNFIIYCGCSALTSVGVMFAKDKDNSFLIFQLGGFFLSVVMSLFSFSYPMDRLLDEVEALRVKVYGSNWYNLPLPCRRNVHILQTMLTFCPKFKTFIGAKISLEYTGKLLNACYCYITTILSMDIK